MRTALHAGAQRLGLSLSEQQLDQLGRYHALLLTWNRRIKLTSVTDPAGVAEKHFLDSLAVVAPSHEALGEARNLVDVGSGAGFPGLVVAVARPDLAVTVVESIQKKAAFLEAIKRELGLRQVTVRAERMETLVAARQRFDLAISRATFAPEEWVRRGTELVAPGGRLLAMVVPEPERSPAEVIETLAPNWPQRFQAARLTPPYLPGRGLLILSGRFT